MIVRKSDIFSLTLAFSVYLLHQPASPLLSSALLSWSKINADVVRYFRGGEDLRAPNNPPGPRWLGCYSSPQSRTRWTQKPQSGRNVLRRIGRFPITICLFLFLNWRKILFKYLAANQWRDFQLNQCNLFSQRRMLQELTWKKGKNVFLTETESRPEFQSIFQSLL